MNLIEALFGSGRDLDSLQMAVARQSFSSPRSL